MSKRELAKLLRGYENKWVALSSDEKKVVAAANTMKKVISNAEKNGENQPVLLKVPSAAAGYIL